MTNFKLLTDTELVIIYQKKQDSMAFGELYNRYNQKVFLYGVKLLKDRATALDLTQDLFIKIATQIKNLKEPVTFVKWLFRIAHNDCINILKKQSKYKTTEWSLTYDRVEEQFDEENALEKEDQMNRLTSAMNIMSPIDQAILMGKYYEKKSVAELQTIYDLSESAVKMRLNRSRTRLKKAMQ